MEIDRLVQQVDHLTSQLYDLNQLIKQKEEAKEAKLEAAKKKAKQGLEEALEGEGPEEHEARLFAERMKESAAAEGEDKVQQMEELRDHLVAEMNGEGAGAAQANFVRMLEFMSTGIDAMKKLLNDIRRSEHKEMQFKTQARDEIREECRHQVEEQVNEMEVELRLLDASLLPEMRIGHDAKMQLFLDGKPPAKAASSVPSAANAPNEDLGPQPKKAISLPASNVSALLNSNKRITKKDVGVVLRRRDRLKALKASLEEKLASGAGAGAGASAGAGQRRQSGQKQRKSVIANAAQAVVASQDSSSQARPAAEIVKELRGLSTKSSLVLADIKAELRNHEGLQEEAEFIQLADKMKDTLQKMATALGGPGSKRGSAQNIQQTQSNREQQVKDLTENFLQIQQAMGALQAAETARARVGTGAAAKPATQITVPTKDLEDKQRPGQEASNSEKDKAQMGAKEAAQMGAKEAVKGKSEAQMQAEMILMEQDMAKMKASNNVDRRRVLRLREELEELEKAQAADGAAEDSAVANHDAAIAVALSRRPSKSSRRPSRDSKRSSKASAEEGEKKRVDPGGRGVQETSAEAAESSSSELANQDSEDSEAPSVAEMPENKDRLGEPLGTGGSDDEVKNLGTYAGQDGLQRARLEGKKLQVQIRKLKEEIRALREHEDVEVDEVNGVIPKAQTHPKGTESRRTSEAGKSSGAAASLAKEVRRASNAVAPPEADVRRTTSRKSIVMRQNSLPSRESSKQASEMTVSDEGSRSRSKSVAPGKNAWALLRSKTVSEDQLSEKERRMTQIGSGLNMQLTDLFNPKALTFQKLKLSKVVQQLKLEVMKKNRLLMSMLPGDTVQELTKAGVFSAPGAATASKKQGDVSAEEPGVKEQSAEDKKLNDLNSKLKNLQASEDFWKKRMANHVESGGAVKTDTGQQMAQGATLGSSAEELAGIASFTAGSDSGARPSDILGGSRRPSISDVLVAHHVSQGFAPAPLGGSGPRRPSFSESFAQVAAQQAALGVTGSNSRRSSFSDAGPQLKQSGGFEGAEVDAASHFQPSGAVQQGSEEHVSDGAAGSSRDARISLEPRMSLKDLSRMQRIKTTMDKLKTGGLRKEAYLKGEAPMPQDSTPAKRASLSTLQLKAKQQLLTGFARARSNLNAAKNELAAQRQAATQLRKFTGKIRQMLEENHQQGVHAEDEMLKKYTAELLQRAGLTSSHDQRLYGLLGSVPRKGHLSLLVQHITQILVLPTPEQAVGLRELAGGHIPESMPLSSLASTVGEDEASGDTIGVSVLVAQHIYELKNQAELWPEVSEDDIKKDALLGILERDTDIEDEMRIKAMIESGKDVYASNELSMKKLLSSLVDVTSFASKAGGARDQEAAISDKTSQEAAGKTQAQQEHGAKRKAALLTLMRTGSKLLAKPQRRRSSQQTSGSSTPAPSRQISKEASDGERMEDGGARDPAMVVNHLPTIPSPRATRSTGTRKPSPAPAEDSSEGSDEEQQLMARQPTSRNSSFSLAIASLHGRVTQDQSLKHAAKDGKLAFARRSSAVGESTVYDDSFWNETLENVRREKESLFEAQQAAHQKELKRIEQDAAAEEELQTSRTTNVDRLRHSGSTQMRVLMAHGAIGSGASAAMDRRLLPNRGEGFSRVPAFAGEAKGPSQSQKEKAARLRIEIEAKLAEQSEAAAAARRRFLLGEDTEDAGQQDDNSVAQAQEETLASEEKPTKGRRNSQGKLRRPAFDKRTLVAEDHSALNIDVRGKCQIDRGREGDDEGGHERRTASADPGVVSPRRRASQEVIPITLHRRLSGDSDGQSFPARDPAPATLTRQLSVGASELEAVDLAVGDSSSFPARSPGPTRRMLFPARTASGDFERSPPSFDPESAVMIRAAKPSPTVTSQPPELRRSISAPPELPAAAWQNRAQVEAPGLSVKNFAFTTTEKKTRRGVAVQGSIKVGATSRRRCRSASPSAAVDDEFLQYLSIKAYPKPSTRRLEAEPETTRAVVAAPAAASKLLAPPPGWSMHDPRDAASPQPRRATSNSGAVAATFATSPPSPRRIQEHGSDAEQDLPRESSTSSLKHEAKIEPSSKAELPVSFPQPVDAAKEEEKETRSHSVLSKGAQGMASPTAISADIGGQHIPDSPSQPRLVEPAEMVSISVEEAHARLKQGLMLFNRKGDSQEQKLAGGAHYPLPPPPPATFSLKFAAKPAGVPSPRAGAKFWKTSSLTPRSPGKQVTTPRLPPLTPRGEPQASPGAKAQKQQPPAEAEPRQNVSASSTLTAQSESKFSADGGQLVAAKARALLSYIEGFDPMELDRLLASRPGTGASRLSTPRSPRTARTPRSRQRSSSIQEGEGTYDDTRKAVPTHLPKISKDGSAPDDGNPLSPQAAEWAHFLEQRFGNHAHAAERTTASNAKEKRKHKHHIARFLQ
eukprot:TRINITY_DN23513_c0_g2_i5.p1 TRINITY_DN23513_c0_g2~~TRINITY_DN23513_c0_g2_i5.p1  ORF type:complete len:2416 (-),score=594.29 TRINITY_DN23513_c0_g2_i5:177-7424(-)